MSVAGKGELDSSGMRHGDERKRTADDVSKIIRRCQNRGDAVTRDSGWRRPDYCPSGIRHEGSVNMTQALIRNVRTCRPDAKGETQMDRLHESQSTNAGHRDGAGCSRDEGSVIGLDRRASIVRHVHVGNPSGEDLHG